ncbi:MAG: TIGR01906 family membrane protein [Defluviitaleaceae bacterium]|nr:TIGR01906 family membrane protein [Defluviitaleaceae bacterium]MCL2239376.1 TIGR01906 family membrane protein [Defluviitaleaceae bacterium]
MRYVLGYAAALFLLVLIFCQSIIIPTFFMPFFRWQYTRLEIAQNIDIDFDELMHVTVELLDYMRGRRENLQGIRATVAGVERGPAEEGLEEFFSCREEIIHMEDVRVLYDILFIVRNVAFWGLGAVVLAMVLLRYKVIYFLARCTREVLAGFLGLALLLVGIVAMDFDRAFEVFHLILFDNDYWILHPARSLLINMVPIQFFIDIAIFIAALMGGVMLVLIALASVYLARIKRKEQLSFGGRR